MRAGRNRSSKHIEANTQIARVNYLRLYAVERRLLASIVILLSLSEEITRRALTQHQGKIENRTEKKENTNRHRALAHCVLSVRHHRTTES